MHLSPLASTTTSFLDPAVFCNVPIWVGKASFSLLPQPPTQLLCSKWLGMRNINPSPSPRAHRKRITRADPSTQSWLALLFSSVLREHVRRKNVVEWSCWGSSGEGKRGVETSHRALVTYVPTSPPAKWLFQFTYLIMEGFSWLHLILTGHYFTLSLHPGCAFLLVAAKCNTREHMILKYISEASVDQSSDPVL